MRERLPERVRELMRTADADVPVIHLADQQRERHGEPLQVRRVAGNGRLEGQHRFDLVALEVLVQKLVDRHVPQMDAQKLRLVGDLPDDERLGDIEQRDGRRVHQRTQDQVQVTLHLIV